MRKFASYLLMSATATSLVACSDFKSKPQMSPEAAVQQALKPHQGLALPTAEDLQQHAEFLKQPDTGLIRVSLQDSDVAPSGPANGPTRSSDLILKNRNQPVLQLNTTGLNIGVIASLGAIEMDQVAETIPLVSHLTMHDSPSGKNEESWKALRQYWIDGFTIDNTQFKSQVEPVIGHAYVMRTISENSYDIVTALRIVRRDMSDGSLIIAWKKIKEFDKPTVNREGAAAAVVPPAPAAGQVDPTAD